MSKHDGNFYCLTCPLFFRTKTKLESHRNVCGNKDFCDVVMSSKDTKIFQFNQYTI